MSRIPEITGMRGDKVGGSPPRQSLRGIIQIYEIIFGFQGFGLEFSSSRPKYAIRGTGILGQIASFVRRLRWAAPTPLALPCPFSTSTWTRTGAERDKRDVAKTPHVEVEFRRFWLYLNVCSAWTIYKNCFQTVAFVCFAWRLQGLNKWNTSSGGGSNARRPAVSVSHLAGIGYVGWARQARSAQNLYFGQYTPELFLDLDISRAWTETTYRKTFISKLASFRNWLLILSPRHFLMVTPRRVWPIVVRLLCRCLSISDFTVK